MSIPSISQLVALYRDTLVADTDLQTFCTDNFSKACTHYVGLDVKKLPGRAQAPFLSLVPRAQVDGQADAMFVWSIDVYMGVDSNVYSDYQGTGSNEMKGLYLCDEMKGIVKDALDALAGSKNLTMDSVSFTLDSDTFPLVVGTMSIESRFTNTIGVSFSL